MKLILIAVFSNLLLNTAYSQQLSTKLYNNVRYLNKNSENNGYLSLALEYKTKSNRVHELELISARYFQKSLDIINMPDTFVTGQPYIYKGFKLRLNYNYKLNTFIKKKNFSLSLYASHETFLENLRGGAGWDVSLVWNNGIDIPYTENTYTGANFSLMPRVDYNFKRFVNVNFSIPVSVLLVAFKRSFIDNPALPKDLQKMSSLSYKIFPILPYIKMGIGFKIYEKKQTRHKSVLYM